MIKHRYILKNLQGCRGNTGHYFFHCKKSYHSMLKDYFIPIVIENQGEKFGFQ